MAIILNDNIKINAGKPSESKYLTTGNTAYTSVAAVNLALPVPVRHIGLTVNIMGVEYWYSGGVANGNLILKTATGGTSANAVTGATNIGFYQGLSGVQVLPINHQTDNNFDGDYYSLYNNYYRGTDGRVHVGTPTDGIPKRGYVKTASPAKSWIWNEYTGDGLLGWILMNGNISEKIGQFDNGYSYYNGSTTFPYLDTVWSGTPPPNGSQVIVDTIRGSLSTGTTIAIGGGVYSKEESHVLEFRTLQTNTPDKIAITSDEAFIYLSGKTQTGANVGGGSNVYKNVSGTTFQFRSICGGGDTTVTQIGNNIIISSTGGTGGGTYDLGSPSVCPVGGMCQGTILTGKTAFQLFEEILVPEIFGTLTAPFSSISLAPSTTIYEIGYCISTLSINGSFSQGCINPQGCSASPKRTGLPTCYVFTGPSANCSFATTGLTQSVSIPNYPVTNGSQTWSVKTCYSAGVQPISSKGTLFSTACPAGETGTVSTSISGILPWYWGKKKVTNVISGADVAAGNKGTLTIPSTSTLPIIYNSASDDYLWFAVPFGITKSAWFVCASNQGAIGPVPPNNLFASACCVSVTSAQGCWTGCSYGVYVSCVTTGTAAGVPMCMS